MSNQAGIEGNLDILRSMAVLLVFVSHFALAVYPGHLFIWGVNMATLGRAGVLLFFVHTSFVLMLSIGRMQQTGWGMVWRFYMRRIFRIYPLSIACCVLVSVCNIPRNMLGSPFAWSWKLFASNVLLIQNLTGDKPLTAPLWSLPYEVQMYVALPLLFLALRKRKVSVLFALMFAAVLLGWRVPLLEFAPCFLAGIWAFFLLRYRRTVFPSWMWPAFLACALSAYCLIDPSRITARKSWTICMVVGVSVPFYQECLTPVIAWTSKKIARYSYGIYLTHYSLMWIFFRRLNWPAGARYSLFAISVVVLPVLAYHRLEKPLIEVGIGLTGPGKLKTAEIAGAAQSGPRPIMVK